MNRLGAALFAVLIVLPAAEVGATAKADREEVRRIVVQEALGSRRVPPSLALAVAEAESDFVANAESSAGASGVMQIMPATGRGEFGVQPEELWEPRLNVRIGIAFLDQLIARYGERWDLALSHYNGGSRVGSGEAARVIPATRAYVDKVLRLERRNARDDAVRQMIAAAEGGAGPGWLPPNVCRRWRSERPASLPWTKRPPTDGRRNVDAGSWLSPTPHSTAPRPGTDGAATASIRAICSSESMFRNNDSAPC